MHGHNYEFVVEVAGEIDNKGWIIDFWYLDDIVNPVIAMIDHKLLNEVNGLENPTAEIIACWLKYKINGAIVNHIGTSANHIGTSDFIYGSEINRIIRNQGLQRHRFKLKYVKSEPSSLQGKYYHDPWQSICPTIRWHR